MSEIQLSQLVNSILKETNHAANPYFKSLQDGSFSKDDFVETQIQFYWAVVFFSRPMAALAAKIPTPELRLEIIRNVWEEHGEGSLTRVHGTTFCELLSRLSGVQPDAIHSRSLWPEVRAFNTLPTGVCVLDVYLTVVALMGIIERMFADISSWIGRGIVNRQWLTNEQMIHYSLHEELDVKHSQDFFDILEKSWEHSLEDRYAIEQGLRLGAYAFNNLYTGLYQARSRRSSRAVRGMHSRAEG